VDGMQLPLNPLVIVMVPATGSSVIATPGSFIAPGVMVSAYQVSMAPAGLQ
jgi:hypothetical protein